MANAKDLILVFITLLPVIFVFSFISAVIEIEMERMVIMSNINKKAPFTAINEAETIK